MGSRGVPPALNGDQQAELKAAVQELPSQAGIDLSNWKAVRRYVSEDDDLLLQRRPFSAQEVGPQAATAKLPVALRLIPVGNPMPAMLPHRN